MAKVIIAAAMAFGLLAAGCIVADKLFPCIGPVERFIRRLPLGGDVE